MKIQLKRSNVLESGQAKEPTSAQMEYGELAVNYSNADPVLFIKDSTDAIVRIAGAGSFGAFDGSYNSLTNKPTIGDGSITINNADGSENATFTVNQTSATTVTLPAGFSGDYDDLTNKPTIGDGSITFSQGGAEVGSITVNQVGNTTIDFSEGGIYTAEAGKGISINASNEIRIGDDWSSIPALPEA